LSDPQQVFDNRQGDCKPEFNLALETMLVFVRDDAEIPMF